MLLERAPHGTEEQAACALRAAEGMLTLRPALPERPPSHIGLLLLRLAQQGEFVGAFGTPSWYSLGYAAASQENRPLKSG